MNTNFIKFLFTVSALLLGVLMLELILGDSGEPLLQSASESDNPNYAEVTLPEIKFSAKTPEMYADMVDRPLFIEGRRPVVESEEAEETQETSQIQDVTLMGVYTLDNQMTALFSIKGDKKQYLKKKLGDEISGWLLQEIEPDRVILEREGGEETVLLRKPKLKKEEAKRPKQPENPFKQAMKQNPFAQKIQDKKREENEK